MGDNIIEQTNIFKYLGYNILIYKMNMDLKGIVKTCNKLKEYIKRNYWKNLKKE
jgi:hypothetical protein